MLLSKTCTYGLLATLFVATQKGKRDYVPIREISRQLNISFHFLTKILQRLTTHNIMNSHRGPNGGVRLARTPDQISLMDIIEALDGNKIFEGCVLGLPGCGETAPCPLHQSWSQSRDIIIHSFTTANLATMSHEIQKGMLRISGMDDGLTRKDH